MISNNRNFF